MSIEAKTLALSIGIAALGVLTMAALFGAGVALLDYATALAPGWLAFAFVLGISMLLAGVGALVLAGCVIGGLLRSTPRSL